MKKYVVLPIIIALAMMGCNASKTQGQGTYNEIAAASIKGDTVRIANDSLEYEVLIIDAGFNGWLAAHGKPRSYYSQQYLEARNNIWVSEWNIRARNPARHGDLYMMPIDYSPQIDYGYEVNYLLYYYLTYFQLTNNIRLGGFSPRI